MKRAKNIYLLVFGVLGVAILLYLVMKALREGNDIRVYLYAAGDLGKGNDIYTGNPYNKYLYSPLFALLLKPLSMISWDVARVIWMFLNVAAAIRLFILIEKGLNTASVLSKKYKSWWIAGVVILSLGFLNHNIGLGQVTILILWITLEGVQLVFRGREIPGAALLALGINIKILPLLVLYYLFLKGKFRAVSLTLAFVGISLLLPAPFIGFGYNKYLLEQWKVTINPAGDRYMFENDNGCSSLNAVIPAFFYDFGNTDEDYREGVYRKITFIPHNTLLLILQASRVLLALSLLYFVFHHSRKRKFHGWYFLWEFGYLMLVSLLIFPHQKKYSMLYFVPAGAYVLFYFFYMLDHKARMLLREKITGILSFALLFILAIMGRDIIGSWLVDWLDFFHFIGLALIAFLFIMALCPPSRMEEVQQQSSSGKEQSDYLGS